MNYSYSNSLSLTSQFSFCGLPFRLDTYAGCSFGCKYCFARTRGGNIDSKKLKASDPGTIIKKFRRSLADEASPKGILTEMIHNRTPIHFGGMSDPFQPIEKHYKSSLTVLKFLAEIDYPTVISTRSTLISETPYIEILKSFSSVVVQFSFSTLIDSRATMIEPNTSAPSKICKAIELLSSKGIKTSIRWQPYIPFYSESPIEFVNGVANLGAFHLGFEHLKFPLEKQNQLNQALKQATGHDIGKLYKDSSQIEGRELVLLDHLKLQRILEVKSLVNQKMMTFGSADNEFQYLSDTACCCSGVDQVPGFENWNKYQIANAIRQSFLSGKKDIHYSSIIQEWKPQGAIDQFINSKSRIEKGESHNTIENYIRHRWEDLESPFNPTRFNNVIFANKYDLNGMKIYTWGDFK